MTAACLALHQFTTPASSLLLLAPARLALWTTHPRSVSKHVLVPVTQSLARSVVRVSARRGEALSRQREEHDEKQEGQRDAEDTLDTPG